MDASRGKRVRISENEGRKKRKKRKKVAPNEFLDVEASVSDSSDEEMEGHTNECLNFIDDDEVNLGGGQDIEVEDEEFSEDDLDFDDESGQRFDTSTRRGPNDSEPVGLDYRLASVVRRYEAQASEGEGHDRQDELASLAERAMRIMPTAQDPNFWKVCVYEGTVEETFWAMHNRLDKSPELASSVFMPPRSDNWICIESSSHQNAVLLCIDLSTIHQPPNVLFVPVNERVQWITWCPTTPRIKSPSWVRIKKSSELRDLLDKDHDLDERLLKYAKDLAFVHEVFNESKVLICLVPRLLVEVGQQGSADYRDKQKKRRRQRLPRLLHPNTISEPTLGSETMHPLHSSVWWNPKRFYDLVSIKTGVYQLTNPKTRKRTRDGDDLVPPFAIFYVPVSALQSDVVPRLKELNLFAEGMAVGAKEMGLNFPHTEFFRWTYENDVAAPVEIGNKVEVKLDMGIAQGVIEDMRFDKAFVRTIKTREELEVDIRSVRRFYQLCDSVKVVRSSMINRRGWVIGIQDDQITVFDRDQKQQFDVKSWQLIPYDDFEMEQDPRFKVGEAVHVVDPLSAEYRKNGSIYSVSDSVIEVIDSRTNTLFMVPPWFLKADTVPGPTVQPPSAIANLLGRWDDDNYKKLVGTWVVVTGPHVHKGLYGRIKEYHGNCQFRVEASSGSRWVDIHVDHLINTGENGPDLRDYHIGLHKIPPAGAYPIPCFQRQPSQPKRAATPLPEEVDVAENNPEDRPISSPSAAAEGLPDAPEASTPATETPMITYGDEVLPANWILRHGLVRKRIYAHVRNSKPNPMEGGGFGKGQYEGQRVLILSGEREDKIEVHVKDRSVNIPAKFLFPQRPTARGQEVVVLSGDRIGEVYMTRKPKPDGSFPLGRPGFSGPPSCIMEPNRLARCDPR
ncbi:hypothetical protein F5887DRAFT_1087234 [Amanita rubescens]|nr:hypothetical protein F5887DRAFT_1087234 [Amanita rubescens]